MKSSAFIFDIDGVVVDSEQLHFDVLKELAPEQVKHFHPEDLIGLSLEETLQHIGVSLSERDIMVQKAVETYNKRLCRDYLRKGVYDVIRFIDFQGLKFGFVSTALRPVCLANLSLLGLHKEPELVAGDDVTRTKPWPDPYLLMLKRLDVSPEEAVVVEDTDIGLAAAREAGIRNVYAWPHELSKGQVYSQASQIIHDILDIPEVDSLYQAVSRKERVS